MSQMASRGMWLTLAMGVAGVAIRVLSESSTLPQPEHVPHLQPTYQESTREDAIRAQGPQATAIPVNRTLCPNAHQEECPDLLQANIRIRWHDAAADLSAVCGNSRSTACALRTATWQQVTCDIHARRGIDESVMRHELNHCRGWDHRGDTVNDYRAAWRPNATLLRYAGL